MFTSFRRIIGLGWQNLIRNGGIAAANIFIIMIPILITSALFSLRAVGDVLVDELQQKADISIYFNESVSEDDILRVKDRIGQISGIEKVEYVSKDMALADFRVRYENNPTLMQSLDEVVGNPLPALLHIAANDPKQLEATAALLEEDDYRDLIYKINYNERKEDIQRVFAFTDNAGKAGLGIFAILASISVLVTFNTVRIAILSRKREIGIQRLVGASRWFIRGQFLVEGLIFGVLAASFSFLTVMAVSWYAGPALAGTLSINMWTHFVANFWTIMGMHFGIGIGLGVLSSTIAVSRHLKV